MSDPHSRTTIQHTAVSGSVPPRTSQRRRTLYAGNRFRCHLCHLSGGAGEPVRMCHHCGRLMCDACSPRLPRVMQWFMHHQETKWLSGRGQRRPLLGGRWIEPAHCPEHVHYSVRLVPWLLLGALLAFLLILLLYGLGAGALLTTLLPVLLFAGWAGLGLGWHTLDSRNQQRLFFPLTAAKPIVRLTERFEGSATLDGHYTEKMDERMPRGKLVAKVRLPATMAHDLEQFCRVHGLTEDALARVPVTAGSVLLEKSLRVEQPSMRWGNDGTRLAEPGPPWSPLGGRRWELSKPLAEWKIADERSGPLEQTLEFPYLIDWWIPRASFRWPFPVQLQARFPERSERRTLALDVLLTGWAPRLSPFVRSVTLRPGPEVPPLSLLPVQGRPTPPRREGGELVVRDLQFEEGGRARLLLRFDEPPSLDGPCWLEGEVVVGMARALSEVELVAFFNPFGVRVERPRLKSHTWVTLRFRINLSSLAYQRVNRHREEFELPTADIERDDAVVRALNQASYVLRVHERVLAPPGFLHEAGPLPPDREVTGQARPAPGREISPMVYVVELKPLGAGTHVAIRVEETQKEGSAPAHAADFARELRALILEADARHRGTGSGGAGRGPSTPPGGPNNPPGGSGNVGPGRGPGLLGKLGRR